MTLARLRRSLAATTLLVMASSAIAQRAPSPEQQIFALQQQLAASQAAAIRAEQRLSAIERQLQQVVNSSETSAHRINMLESTLQELRRAQEARAAAPEPVAAPAIVEAAEAPPEETAAPASNPPAATPPAAQTSAPEESDPGEDAYTEGFKAWEARRFDQAIASLRAFTSAFPKHRRVSWANNLIGRSLLDKGEARPAAEVFLANYRGNPRGGRAQDSLYYLGQALMKLGQPEQACKAYSELTSVYGSAVRAELLPLLAAAQREASCS